MRNNIELNKANLMDNLDRLHPMDVYSLAEMAIKHFDKTITDDCTTWEVLQASEKLGFTSWWDSVKKYNDEVGYKDMIFKVEI